MAPMVPIVMFLVLLTIDASCVFSRSLDGFRFDLIHTHPRSKFTPLQLHMRAIQQSKHRMANKSSSANSVATTLKSHVEYGDMVYLMELAIGTPPVSVMVAIDTENDLTWTPCQPCPQCPTPPTGSLYDPSKSSTFSKIHCNTSLCQSLYQPTCAPDCMYSGYYLNAGYAEGVLATETLTLKSVDGRDVSIPDIAFGCGPTNQSTDYYGVVGLNKEPLSLIRQLGVGKFSHCFTRYGDSKTSPIFFGSQAVLNESSSIPLPYSSNLYYSIHLKGITVGATLISIPKIAFEGDAPDTLHLETRYAYGVLMNPAFELVKKELAASLKLPIVDPLLTNGGLCFSLPSNSSIQVPKLVFHFEGADLELPVDNYMIRDPSTGLLCFAMLESPYIFSFGSFQLQNMHVVYDLVQEKVSISPAQCDRL